MTKIVLFLIFPNIFNFFLKLFCGLIKLIIFVQIITMKTPMQFLKEEIESKVFPPTYNDGKLTDYQYGHNIAYSVVLTLAEYLIEVEKEHIMDFFLKGYSIGESDLNPKVEFEKYYNQTYNQNK